jgi:hypothetical protein
MEIQKCSPYFLSALSIIYERLADYTLSDVKFTRMLSDEQVLIKQS